MNSRAPQIAAVVCIVFVVILLRNLSHIPTELPELPQFPGLPQFSRSEEPEPLPPEAVRRNDLEALLTKASNELAASRQREAAALDEARKSRAFGADATLLEINLRQEGEILRLQEEIERLRREKEDILSDKREVRRMQLIGERLGTLLLGHDTFFDTQIEELTAGWVEFSHRDGVERVDMELLPDRLRKKLVYHKEEARAALEEDKERKKRVFIAQQAVEKQQADFERGTHERRQAAVIESGRDKLLYQVRKIEAQIRKLSAQARTGSRNQRYVAQERIKVLNRELSFAKRDVREYEIDHGLTAAK